MNAQSVDSQAHAVAPFHGVCDALFGGHIASLKYISIELDQQRLRVIDQGLAQVSYAVSTAANGAGNRDGTGCTPLGWHTVCEKFGADTPMGTVFKGRVPAGRVTDFCSNTDDDLITSRILWLAGAQPAYNADGSVDSKRRYIYIHGTAQEHLIGQAVSHGCIRMRNDNVIDLFEMIEVGTPVLLSLSTGL